METKKTPVFHGYELHAFSFFQDYLTKLTEEVEQLMILPTSSLILNTSYLKLFSTTLQKLFFQFNSNAPKTIIYVWMNDETTQRKAGSKTDVYAVF